MSKGTDELTILLAEHDALIKEKHLRMDHRVRLLTFNLTISGVLMAVALNQSTPLILLVVPLICGTFGLLTVYHNRAVYDIGRHMRFELKPRFKELSGTSVKLWDSGPVTAKRHFRRVFDIFHFPIILTFVVPAVASLGLFFYLEKRPIIMVPGGLICVDVLLLFYFVIAYARHVYVPNVRAQPQAPVAQEAGKP